MALPELVRCLLSFVVAFTTAHGQQSAPPSLALVGVSVVDVAAPRADQVVRSDQTVVVVGSRIVAVGAVRDVRVPAGAQHIDARGKFLIPGLWDMHLHLANTEERIEYFPKLLVANGVTGIRDMATALGAARARRLQASIDRGDIVGPRIGALTGTILEGPGSRTGPIFRRVASDLEARQAVDALKADGADFVKVYNGLSRETYHAIIDEARRTGMPVVGHIPASMSATEVSDLGQRSVEHSGGMGSTPGELLMSCSRDEAALRPAWRDGLFYTGPPQGMRAHVEAVYRNTELRAAATYDDAKASTLFEKFVKNGTWHVPTLVLDTPTVVDQSTLTSEPHVKYMRPATQLQWRRDQAQRMSASGDVAAWQSRVIRRHRLIGDMYRAGVSMLAGTDANVPYVVPGFSLHDELELLVKAGLPPVAALRTATLNAARFLGRTDSMGTIETGKLADLVLLTANPLEAITNTQRIDAVVLNGRYLSRAALDELLADVERTVRSDSGHD
jgi:imidazolonepropionase-like amidohydrolase